MAQVAYPTDDARIVDFSLTPSVVGQINHEIPGSGALKVLDRGYGRWQGVVRFGVLQGEAAQKMTAMFAALNGTTNFIELPVRGHPTIGGAAAISDVDGATYTLAVEPEGLAVGAMVRSGARLFVISAMPAADKVNLWPTFPLAEEEMLSPATTVRARSRINAVPDIPSNPHWGGPWVWNWQEAL